MAQVATAPTRRERNRAARKEQFLQAALAVVGSDGLEALTMQRVADDLDCAIGTIYSYFPSKGALVAEIQRAAIETLHASYRQARPGWDELISAATTDEALVALTRVTAFGRFWLAAAETFPEEFNLLQGLMGQWRGIIPLEDTALVVPAAMALLGEGAQLLDAAVAAGALREGSTLDRVIIWAAALNGVHLTSSLSRIDASLFELDRLASQLANDLLTGWGAAPELVAEADRLVVQLAARGPLAPKLPVRKETAQ
jgi:AcrR family transcriptional regulator